MNNSFLPSFSTLLALTRRDLKVFLYELLGTFIDGMVIVVTEAVLFGYLMPLMGMPKTTIAPLYIGTMMWVLFFLGENLAIHHVFDLKHNRFIDYQLSLPLGHQYLFAHYVLSFAIKTTIISLPLLYFGITLLGERFQIISFNSMGFIAIYLMSILFIALFFLYLSFAYSFTWFMDNVWPRILSPLWGFGCVFFVWRQAYDISPILGYFFLLNPLTYISEGMRSAIIGGPEFINVWICVGMLAIFCSATIYGLRQGISHYLDPV